MIYSYILTCAEVASQKNLGFIKIQLGNYTDYV